MAAEPSHTKPEGFKNSVQRINVPGLPGISNAFLWKTSETPSKDGNTKPNFDGTERIGDRINGFVCSGGTNFFIQDLAPGAEIPMHRSNTIDYIIVISGTIVSTSPEKPEEDFRLTAGDVLVRKANSHGWKNIGPEWVRWACIIVDAKPVVLNGQTLVEGFM
ncbi:hypothetical protein Clacol_007075 [Clathrus columnatus]|uniref:Cupin type-2 domain-containing protein n=1 Tax=Clathrus columnatus TaxID=1419009 RepID=A0AAV5AJ02_9AGAM|nr:hypothetical protein Clacol_007075 [Clathrus columnatus]